MVTDYSYQQSPDPGEPDLESLIDAYQGPLYRFAMSLTRSENDACDLVQEAFLAWADKKSALRDPSRAKSWLFTTLHRRFLESKRRTTRFPQFDLETTESELPEVEPEGFRSLQAQEILDLLAKIDEQFRAPVALFYLEDNSYTEIAETLEIPLGTVKSRIARGLTQLKKLVARELTEKAYSGGKHE